MWLRSLLDSLKPRSARTTTPRARRPAARNRPSAGPLQLESLEGRSLPSAYLAYNLGTLGGDLNYPGDINVLGQVVGASATAADSPGRGVNHAFIWNRGTMIDLGSLGGPTFPSSATGINDAGQVVGNSFRSDPNGGYDLQRGFIVTPEDTDGNGAADRWYRDNDGNGINDLMRDLGTLGGTYANAYDINNAGQVVGMSDDGAEGLYAFRWQAGQMTSLGALNGPQNWSYGYGINDSGRVVGVSSADYTTPAFHWDSVRGLTNLGTLPGHFDATAFAINNAGVAVGTSGAYQVGRAVTWSPSTPNGTPGSAVSLGMLPGDTASDASDINNLGQVVGSSQVYALDPYWGYLMQSSRAFLWQAGAMTALEDLMQPGSGLSFHSGGAINDVSQIAILGRRGDGREGTYLLSPEDIGIPLMSISDVTIVEGNGGISNAVFTVTLSAASSQTVSAVYATANGSASPGLDYVVSSGTVTFNPGETSKTITVPVYADTLDERDETLFVNLSRTINAAFADSQALGTIRNDDPVPTLEVSDATIVEGDAGTTDAVFTVSLAPAADRERTVWFQTEGYNDESYYTDDFEVVGAYLTFSPGETVKSFAVRVLGDTTPEPDETFRVLVSYDGAASLSDDGIGTIRNDEPLLPMPDVSNPTLIEGNAGSTSMVFTVTLVMGPLAEPAAFTYQTASLGATAGSDYQASSGTLTFAPGETQKTIDVPVYGDTLFEDFESFSLTVFNPTQPPFTQDTGYATIANDDPIPTVSIGNVTALEGNSGTTSFAFTVTLSAPSGVPFTYGYATEVGTAGSGSDFQYSSDYVVFGPGETSKTVGIPVYGDMLFEADETFFVQLYENVWDEFWTPIPGARGVGTIQNDDLNFPLMSLTDVTVTEGNSGTKNAVFTIRLSAASNQTVTVNFSTADGSARGGSDYEAKSGTLTFAPGQASKVLTVPVIGDRVGEPNKTFFVNLSGATNATIVDGQGVGTIVDDEPRISISEVSKKEGKRGQTTQFTFTVTLSAAYDQPVAMSYRTVDGNATVSDGDYTLKTGTLTIAPGQTTKTITIEVKGDSKKEANEVFYLDLFGNSSNSLFTKKRGIGTILNDD